MQARALSLENGPNDRVSLDANATYGLIPEVVEFLHACDPTLIGNPSSVHRSGQRARALLEEVRSEVRVALGLTATDRVIFTSGATEANNLVLNGVRDGTPPSSEGRVPEIIISAVEHPSVREPARALRASGWRLHEVAPPSVRSAWSPEQCASPACRETRLASFMLANNETGEVLPVRAIFDQIRARSNALCHTDATQAVGRMELSLAAVGADALSFSGHKIGALSGVGVLIVRAGVQLTPLLFGGPQEERWRAGTENVLGIATLGIALRAVRRDLMRRIAAFRSARDAIIDAILTRIPGCEVLRQGVDRLPNTACIRIPGVSAADLVVALDLAGVEASFGSACASGKPDPSHVLLALGLSEEGARECLRVSVRADYPRGAIARATQVMVEVIAQARGELPKVVHG